MKSIIFSPFGEHPLLNPIATKLNLDIGEMTLRQFPDGETYIKFISDIANKKVILLASLNDPNPKVLPLLFIAATAKELGAKEVGLCTPYLAYMRQDKQFNPGEGITSKYSANVISKHFDWLVTLDPHLHRYKNLNEIYSIPNSVLHAAKQISAWISYNIKNPILIGPDSESEQWVSKVAHDANAPYLILEKIRHGDHDVEITPPDIAPYLTHTPVLVDDIISTARTMITTIHHLQALRMQPPVCIGIHAVFAGNAYEDLLQTGVQQIVTCNTIPHLSNKIDVSDIVINAMAVSLQ